MSLLKCNIHGYSGAMTNASKSICEKVVDSEPIIPDSLSIVNVVYKDDDGSYMFDEKYYLTKDEAEKLLIDNEYEISTESEERALHDKLKPILGLVCVKCFRRYMHEKNILPEDIDI